MRIAVTGASGFVGGYMVDHLLRLGHEVIALVRRTKASPAFPTETMDVESYQAVYDCLSRVRPQALVHCAAQSSVERSWADPESTYRTNVLGPGNLMEALKERPVRVLLLGSAQQYRRQISGIPLKESDPLAPGSPYAVSKLAQENIGLIYHRRYGLEVIITRSFNHTGPGQSAEYAVGSFCSQVAAVESGAIRELRVGNLEAIRDLLDVRDVVAAYAALLEGGKAGEVYNVCSGQGVRMGDLLNRIMEMAKISPRVPIIAESRHGSAYPDVLVGDLSKISAAVGWVPEFPLDRSLAESLDWYRGRQRADLA